MQIFINKNPGFYTYHKSSQQDISINNKKASNMNEITETAG